MPIATGAYPGRVGSQARVTTPGSIVNFPSIWNLKAGIIEPGDPDLGETETCAHSEPPGPDSFRQRVHP